MIKLYKHQLDALSRMRNGCVLNGGVGSGKSLTALSYYHLENGGNIEPFSKMKKPCNLYIITPAKKRDSLEWEKELSYIYLSAKPELNTIYNNKVVVDSWNNIVKYKNVKNSFFIFDEQRVVGSGVWVKTFLEIAKNNKWILLSATPGDNFEDYIPLFIANGFYKNKSEFISEHVVYKQHSKFPQIDRYLNVRKLSRLRDKILVNMDFLRPTTRHHHDVWVEYDKKKYKEVQRDRWNPYKNEPIQQAAGLCYVLRRVVNGSTDRIVKIMELLENTPRAIIFYNFDYELDALMYVFQNWPCCSPGDPTWSSCPEIAQWNGHKHQPIPDCDNWVYLVQYNAGCEAWNCIKTDTIIFYSQNYSYKIMEQACGRIDRLNTPYTDLHYYHLKSKAPIDLGIARAIEIKKDFNERKFATRF